MKTKPLYLLFVVVTGLSATGCGVKMAPPGQGEFTILLYQMNNPGTHVEMANIYKKRTQKATGWTNLFVINGERSSKLYWGEYLTRKDAMKNLKKAKAFRTPKSQAHPQGAPLFAHAMAVPLPGVNPGPPKWDLYQTKAYCSVLIAVFENNSDINYHHRRQDAVSYCERLRKENYDAYFFHGPRRSGVAIGNFSKGAIDRTVTKKWDPSINDYIHVENVKILDSRIKIIQAKFPHLAFNGSSRRLGTRVTRPDPKNDNHYVLQKTFLFVVKKEKDAGSGF